MAHPFTRRIRGRDALAGLWRGSRDESKCRGIEALNVQTDVGRKRVWRMTIPGRFVARRGKCFSLGYSVRGAARTTRLLVRVLIGEGCVISQSSTESGRRQVGAASRMRYGTQAHLRRKRRHSKQRMTLNSQREVPGNGIESETGRTNWKDRSSSSSAGPDG
jgi:hypothetical protein